MLPAQAHAVLGVPLPTQPRWRLFPGLIRRESLHVPHGGHSHVSSSGAAKEPGRGRTNVAGRPEPVSRSRVLIGQTPGSRLTVQLPLSTHSNRLIRVVGFTTRHTDCKGETHRLQRARGEAALLAAARAESRQEGGGRGENMKNPGGTERCVGAELPTPRAAAQRVGIHRQRRNS